MSDTTQKAWKSSLPAEELALEFHAEIAAYNAEREAKAAAREAAARQEQKDIIKEAVLEALREAQKPTLLRVMQVDRDRLANTVEKTPVELRVDGATLRAAIAAPKRGYFARLWATLRGE